ncbi:MAG: ABC transporter ATP-binding protein/permease [Flavobacteriaceae bacterium]|nr:ABC transporter ATP-binding protein/permease [Flavobacteriaceae bacterium]
MSEVKGNPFDKTLLTKLLAYSKPYKWVLFLVTLTAISLSAFAVYRPMLVGRIVDQAIKPKDPESLLFYILLVLAVLILEVVSQLSFNYLANYLGESVIKDIRVKLFKHMVRFKMTYFDSSSIGVLVTRAVADMQRIGEIFSQGLFMIVSDVLKMSVVAIVMLAVNWKLSLIVFAILPVLLYATRLFQKAMKTAFIEVRNQVAALNSFVQERVSGIKIVQLFGREAQEEASFDVLNKKHQDAWIKTVWYNSVFFPVAEIVSSITIGLIVWFGAMQNLGVVDRSEYGTIFSFILLSEMLFRPLRQIADKFNTLQMGMVAADRVFKILDADHEVELDGKVKRFPLQGKIVFDQVVFGYKPEQDVLHGISFTAEPGETIAIVGATGAGKSTIINLINRFYRIKSGHIYIDDIDIHDFELNSLRSNMAVVLQDVFLFADTIENNITLKNSKITLSEIEEAAKAIGVHEFFMKLPGGYQFNVKERGGMLSSGQRQLLAFLRAYVTNPSILILDEATASIDGYSEKLIQDATLKITQGRTSIVIAHRLATIQKADKILVMDSGKIVEMGTHDRLIAQGGYYTQLYEAQFTEA